MPMKEKILDSLPTWVMTTALLETATGRGLSLGSSAAWRVAARKKNSSAGDGFFIDEILAAATGIGTEVKPSVRDTENTARIRRDRLRSTASCRSRGPQAPSLG